MKNSQKPVSTLLAACIMLIFMLDIKTTLTGALDGLVLCIRTIIPSLFPFIFLSGIINSGLLGNRITLLEPLRRLCKIPKGSESILLLGLIAGYPVGAQIITQSFRKKQLPETVAKRMIGFCNNAGPAFIFGMISVMFSSSIIPWIIWFIHIVSALLVGYILPGEPVSTCQINQQSNITTHTSLQNTIKTMSVICGWVVLFRIIISYFDKWFLWMLPVTLQVILSGLLELSNGCIMLQNIPNEGIRFLLICPMLAFGGLCVTMQTNSVSMELFRRNYFPGKVLQTLFSILISLLLQPILFKNTEFTFHVPLYLFILGMTIIIILVIKRKKMWHLKKECCIIPLSDSRKGQIYAISKKNNSFLQLLPTRHRHG